MTFGAAVLRQDRLECYGLDLSPLPFAKHDYVLTNLKKASIPLMFKGSYQKPVLNFQTYVQMKVTLGREPAIHSPCLIASTSAQTSRCKHFFKFFWRGPLLNLRGKQKVRISSCSSSFFR